ncbi:MAG: hypothetical protein ACTS73_03070 [Arsenophonus sp. NEOnobi-MAG3]
MIWHEKSIIRLSAKSDMISDLLYELIRNGDRQLIATAVEAK